MEDRMKEGSCTSSSAVTVFQSDELLTEILLRLPLKLIFRFKYVSKRWNSVISNPYFRRIYISRNKSSFLQLLGFFQVSTTVQSKFPKELRAPPLSFLPTCEEGMPIRSRSFIKNVGFFIGGCSEGLILCGYHPKRYFVCNPITNQWVSLPRPSLADHGCAIGFICDNNDAGGIHFKVIRVCLQIENMVQIETFSSRTCKWRQSKLASPCTVLIDTYNICDVVDGVIYWTALGENRVKFLVAYNPEKGNGHLWLIKLPTDIWVGIIGSVGQSPDGLLQIALYWYEKISFWVLRKKLTDYSFSDIIPTSEWILIHEVEYLNISVECPKTKTMIVDPVGDIAKYPPTIAFHPHDSRLVYFNSGWIIFCYNLETQKAEQIDYHDYPGKIHLICVFYPYFQCSWPYSLPLIGTKNSRSLQVGEPSP